MHQHVTNFNKKKDAITLWLNYHEFMEFEKRTQLNINIKPDLLKSLKLKSTIEDKNLSDYIIGILESHLLNNDDNELSSLINTKLAEFEKRLKKVEEKNL